MNTVDYYVLGLVTVDFALAIVISVENFILLCFVLYKKLCKYLDLSPRAKSRGF